MTAAAAEDPSNFQNSFCPDESENLKSLLSQDITDSDASVISKTLDDTKNREEVNNSIDSRDTELSGTSVIDSPEEQKSSNFDEKNESETPEKEKDEEWLDIMGSGDFKKKTIKPGLGQDTRPTRGDYVVVDASYYVNGTLFEEKVDLKFIIGDLDVIQGIDLVVCLMEKGEKAKVMIPSKLAYGTVGLLPDVPPNADIECDIELKEIEPINEETLSVAERLKLGNEKRSRGNFFYDRAQFIDAIHCYERAAEYLDGVRDGSNSSPEELQEVVDMRLKVYNNMAASHLKLNAYSAALKSVESVLKVQPKNVKALFRKGKILGTQGLTDEAIACMKAVANLEPETKVIQVELTKLRNRKKKEEQTQKAMYQRMFKSEPKKIPSPVSQFRKWSFISCGVLAVAIGSAVAYRQYHT